MSLSCDWLDADVAQEVRPILVPRDAIHLAADADALRARLDPHHLAVETTAIHL